MFSKIPDRVVWAEFPKGVSSMVPLIKRPLNGKLGLGIQICIGAWKMGEPSDLDCNSL